MTTTHEPASTPSQAAPSARAAGSRRSIPAIEGRRPMAAGHVIVVMMAALLIGTVLNAPGLYRTARTQPDGWRRDIAIGVMTPIRWISVNLGLSLPREFLQSATGQEGADKIDTFVPTPVGLAAEASPTTTTMPVATPYDKVRIWIGGDSLAETPGQSFLRRADGQVTDIRGLDSRVSTGLARPDVFNWFSHVQSEMARTNPGVVVLTFGANDDQSLIGGPGGKTIGPFGSDAWKEEYRRRVAGMMDLVIAENRRVIWTGVPVVRNDERSARYAELNTIYQEEAAKRPGKAFYVDTRPLLAGPDGAYVEEVVINGTPVKVRASDGIHFERSGGDIIADAQIRMLGSFWDLTTGRNATTTTTTAPPPPTPPR